MAEPTDKDRELNSSIVEILSESELQEFGVKACVEDVLQLISRHFAAERAQAAADREELARLREEVARLQVVTNHCNESGNRLREENERLRRRVLELKNRW